MSALSRTACQLPCFFTKFAKRVLAALKKPACASVLDPRSEWEAYFAPFCQVTTTSGTQWACNGQGDFQLLKPNGSKNELAVLEFLDHLGSPSGFLVKNPGDEVLFRLNIAALYEMGYLLPVKYLCGADGSERRHGKPLRPAFENGHDAAQNSQHQQRGKHAHCLNCPVKSRVDRFERFSQGKPPVVVGNDVIGVRHSATASASPRPERLPLGGRPQ